MNIMTRFELFIEKSPARFIGTFGTILALCLLSIYASYTNSGYLMLACIGLLALGLAFFVGIFVVGLITYLWYDIRYPDVPKNRNPLTLNIPSENPYLCLWNHNKEFIVKMLKHGQGDSDHCACCGHRRHEYEEPFQAYNVGMEEPDQTYFSAAYLCSLCEFSFGVVKMNPDTDTLEHWIGRRIKGRRGNAQK